MLVFIADELLNPKQRNKYNIALNFVAYAFIRGDLYSHSELSERKRSKGKQDRKFIIRECDESKKGNQVVYGALFTLNNAFLDLSVVDGYNHCMYSILGMNHSKAMIHREEMEVTIIHFDTLEDLAYLRYKEGTKVNANVYFGNIKHPKIRTKVLGKYSRRYRLHDGIDAVNFKKLFLEVNNEKHVIRNTEK